MLHLLMYRYQESFTRIISADCFWVSDQHVNLVQSIKLLLDRNPGARVLVIAGLHTGRSVLAHFFHIAEENGLISDEDGIEERSVIDGVARRWDEFRTDEDIIERKKWLIVAKLRWKVAACGV